MDVHRILMVVILASGLAVQSAAEAARPDISGTWAFETERYRAGLCRLYGTLRLRPTPEDGVYRGAMTAIEDCEGEERWVVEQTNTAFAEDGQLSIQSTIVSFLEASADPQLYAPDHFALEIESANLMVGQLVSAVSAPVEFRRTTDGIS